MINLIPPRAKRKLLKEYWVRVISSWLILWAIVLLVGSVILFPVYVLISSQVSVYKEVTENASTKVVDYKNVSSALIESSKQAKILIDEDALIEISYFIDLFESLEGHEVIIDEVGVSRGEVGIDPMTISGIADTRQALAAFRDKLNSIDEVLEVDLPVSNLARGKDIPFTITITFNNEIYE